MALRFAQAYIIEDTLFKISDEYLVNTDKKPMTDRVKVVINHIKSTIKHTKPDGVPILIPGGMNRFVLKAEVMHLCMLYRYILMTITNVKSVLSLSTVVTV